MDCLVYFLKAIDICKETISKWIENRYYMNLQDKMRYERGKSNVLNYSEYQIVCMFDFNKSQKIQIILFSSW